jgi:hypothetical protein
MIGYRIALKDLNARIEAHKPGWSARAKERKEAFRKAGKFNEKKSIWSEIKPVYMTLQGEAKCIFCERKLESVEKGTGEQAVEHFRPKGVITAWKGSAAIINAGINVTPPPADARGYFLLAYHPFNYTASCIPCNSALKGSKFPILGKYDYLAEEPPKLASERPLLIYGVGDIDDDPEQLVEFYGVSPTPVAAKGYERHRAMVSIEFFALDDLNIRKNLLRERAVVITALYPQLKGLTEGSKARRRIAKQLVDGFTSAKSAHTNCARSFKRLFDTAPEEAQRVFELTAGLIETIS